MSNDNKHDRDTERVAEVLERMTIHMNKKMDLLDRLKEDGVVMEELNLPSADMAVTLLYLGKLKEAGFIEMESAPIFTASGFDLAMDVVEAGWKLSPEDCLVMCGEIFNEMPMEDHKPIATLVYETQEQGIKKLIEIISNTEDKEDQND